MKIIKKEYVKVLEWAFKIAYLLLGVATFNAFLYDSPVQPFLVDACLVLGGLTLLGRLAFFKDYWKTPYWIILGLFCVAFLLSMIMNREYGAFFADFKWLIWTGMLFFLLYVCDTKREKESYKKEFTVLSHILIIYSAIASVAGIWLMANLYHGSWWSSNDELMQAGFHWGRLWGVYTDPNYGGVFTVAAVLMCVYFAKIRKKWLKIPYILIIAADYLYIVFCDSRTAEVGMVLAAGFWLIYTGVQKKAGKKTIAYILIACVFAGVFVGGTSVIKSQYNDRIQQEIQKQDAQNKANTNTNANSNSNSNKQKSKTSMEEQKVGRQAELEKDVTNGRLALWASGIEVWKTKPIFGTGYNSFLPYANQELPETYAVNNPQGDYVSLHNEYLDILVYHGVLGAAVFLAFMVAVIWRWLKTFRSIAEEDRDYIGVLSACCIVIATAMLFLLEGLHTNSPGTFILWTFLGYLMHYSYKSRETKA